MKSVNLFSQTIFLFIISLNSVFFAQTFNKTIFIFLPGDNYNFNLLQTEHLPFQETESYITWINNDGSNYTVYLKKISPEFGENIIISSDVQPKSNPKVAFNRYNEGIKIVWENFSNGYYQILRRNYANDSLSNIEVICDSINSEPQISLSINRIIWIDNGNLMERRFYPDLTRVNMIDTSSCSSPAVFTYDNETFTQIIYEKNENERHNISLAEYGGYPALKWTISVIDTGQCFNPNFSMDGIIYEKHLNGVSKIAYSNSLTNNKNCNYFNPDLFSYPIPTKNNLLNEDTPFFITFDSDSIQNNREVFYKTYSNWLKNDTIINISDMEGADLKPKVTNIIINDTGYVAIFWEHQTGLKTDIWMATTKFNPIIGDVGDDNLNPDKFVLYQNYPNPFNPSTTIQFSIPSVIVRQAHYDNTDVAPSQSKSDIHVTLKVYDILGNEVATLVNEDKPAGNYEIKFDGSNLASGIYFYKLQSGSFAEAKKLLLLK
jgi:hypothetical protein